MSRGGSVYRKKGLAVPWAPPSEEPRSILNQGSWSENRGIWRWGCGENGSKALWGDGATPYGGVMITVLPGGATNTVPAPDGKPGWMMEPVPGGMIVVGGQEGATAGGQAGAARDGQSTEEPQPMHDRRMMVDRFRPSWASALPTPTSRVTIPKAESSARMIDPPGAGPAGPV